MLFSSYYSCLALDKGNLEDEGNKLNGFLIKVCDLLIEAGVILVWWCFFLTLIIGISKTLGRTVKRSNKYRSNGVPYDDDKIID